MILFLLSSVSFKVEIYVEGVYFVGVIDVSDVCYLLSTPFFLIFFMECTHLLSIR